MSAVAKLRQAVLSVRFPTEMEALESRCLLSLAFGAPSDIATENDLGYPTTAIAADFDGDRDLDVAGIGYDRVAWYANDGTGNFGSRRTITTNVGGQAPGPGSLAAGDINGDRRADLVVVNYEYPVDDPALLSRVVWYGYQPKSETWSARTITVGRIGGLQPVVLADLDKDGDQDVITSNYRFEEDVRVVWFENRSGGTTWAPHVVSSDGSIGEGSRALAVGDMNRDGWIDIVAGARFSGTVVTYLNPKQPQSKPDNAWSAVMVDPVMNEMTGVTVGDLNRDGALDIAAVTDNPYDEIGEGSTGRVVWYPGSVRNPGTFGEPQILKGPGEYQRPWSVEATDLDKDGDVDLLVGAVNHVDWFSNRGDGTFDEPRNIGDVADAWSRAADLNGDGRLDVLSAVAPAYRIVWYAAGDAGSISGRVFHDLDRDGVWDGGEKARSGQKVYVDRNNNAIYDPYEPSAVTSVDGRYSIAGLSAGRHTVRPALDVAWYRSPPSKVDPGVAVTLPSGGYATVPNVGVYYAPATIAGRVFNDRDRDGVWDAGEHGLAGQEVYLDKNGNVRQDDDEPSRTTDARGNYRFEGLGSGTFTVWSVPSTAWYRSHPADSAGVELAIAPGEVSTTARHGLYYAPASISGRVFNDLDRDGVRDAGERGIAGRTVFIDRDGDSVPSSADTIVETDSLGRYVVNGLGDGYHFIRQVVPFLWTQSLPDGYDWIMVDLAKDERHSGVDIGSFYGPVSFSGHVFNDLDRDGIWEVHEPPLPNCRVYDDANSNAIFDPGEFSAVTNAVGQFKFVKSPPGAYHFALDLPPSWQWSYPPDTTWLDVYAQPGDQVAKLLLGVWQHPNWPAGVVGPFVEGTARYSRVGNGGFEQGLSGWVPINTELGTFAHAVSSPLQGSGSAVADTDYELLGAGFAIGQSVPVTPGHVYVLSAMVRAESGAGGSAYLDLGDAAFEPGRGPSGVLADMSVTGTQFIYSAFLVPSYQTEVFVRVVRDGFAGLTVPGKSVWFDEIAVTPLSQFRPPTRA